MCPFQHIKIEYHFEVDSLDNLNKFWKGNCDEIQKKETGTFIK